MACNEKKKIGKLQMAVLLRTILPVLVMCIIILIAVMLRTRSSLEEEVYRSLEAVAESVVAAYDAMYPGDYVLVGDKVVSLYKGDQELTEDHAYLDSVKYSGGMDLTMFYKDVRILTTLKDESGMRYVGSGVHTGFR